MPSFKILLINLSILLLLINCQSETKQTDLADIIDGPLRFYASSTLHAKGEHLIYPEGVKHVMVESSEGDYKFLHDPAIIYHNGALIAAWYSCPEEEIEDESSIRARRSFDGGLTWSEVEVIAEDKEKEGVFYVPAQMLSFNDNLYAFVGKMTGHDRIINTTTYKYEEGTKNWKEIGEAGDLFLPNCTPVKLGNGNWIIAGRVASSLGELPLIPAVMISSGDDIEKSWRVVKLTQQAYKENQYPESTIIVKDEVIYAFVRADGPENRPDVYISNDFGETWKKVAAHDFSAISAKLYAGRLNDGRGYMVYNYVHSGALTQSVEDRTVLAISVSKDGEDPFSFSNTYKVQSTGTGAPHLSHYPCVLEHNGNLYIVYTASFSGETKRQCQLAIIPVKSLNTR